MFNCAKCGEALTEPGGLAFSPPGSGLHNSTVEEYHICPPCWGYFLRWLYRKGEPVFPLPPVRAPLPVYPAPYLPDPGLPEYPGMPSTEPRKPPYTFTCETGVPAGGSLTPR